MKAHPPVAAEPSPYDPREQARPSRFVLAMRRLAIGAAGLAVAVLAAAACVLSFDDVRALAMQAGARADLAYLYPAAFDALLVTALISFMLLGTARPLARVQAGFVLFLLLAAASWANVSMAMRFSINPRLGAVIVGVVPWLMLLIGLWLLTLLIKHAQVRRAAYEAVPGASPDIVPFDGSDAPQAPEPRDGGLGPDDDTAPRPRPDFARPAPAPAPVHQPTALGGAAGAASGSTSPSAEAAEPTAASTVSTPSTAPEERPGVVHEPPVPAPPTQPYPVMKDPVASPVPASPEPASPPAKDGEAPGQSERGLDDGEPRGTREATSLGAEPEREVTSLGAEPEAARPTDGPAASDDVPAPDRDVEAVAAVSPAPLRNRPKRPIQWGDLLRAPQGDVLVHPRREQDLDPDDDTAAAPASAQTPDPRERGAQQTDWEPEDTETGPPEADAASDEAETSTGGTVIPVWPPDAIDTRPNVTMSADTPQPDATSSAAPEKSPETERDTQPYPHLRTQAEPLDDPDPAHQTEAADPEELAGTPAAGGPTVPLAPPSGRMRSTPVPPKE